MPVKNVPTELVDPPEWDARTALDDEKFRELVESIREFGVLQPLVVRPTGDRFEIIIGARRRRAGIIVGLPSLPCDVRDGSDQDADVMKFHENIHREDLSHLDQARTFGHFRDDYGMTEEAIAQIAGKSRPYVAQHLGLLKAPDTVKDALLDGTLSFSVARELLQIGDPEEQARFQRFATESGATAKVVHDWAQEWKRDEAPPESQPQASGPPTGSRAPATPMYPCHVCETPTDLIQLVIWRLCPGCATTLAQAILSASAEATPQNTPPSS